MMGWNINIEWIDLHIRIHMMKTLGFLVRNDDGGGFDEETVYYSNVLTEWQVEPHVHNAHLKIYSRQKMCARKRTFSIRGAMERLQSFIHMRAHTQKHFPHSQVSSSKSCTTAPNDDLEFTVPRCKMNLPLFSVHMCVRAQLLHLLCFISLTNSFGIAICSFNKNKNLSYSLRVCVESLLIHC